jgi:hypothetical protein
MYRDKAAQPDVKPSMMYAPHDLMLHLAVGQQGIEGAAQHKPTPSTHPDPKRMTSTCEHMENFTRHPAAGQRDRGGEVQPCHLSPPGGRGQPDRLSTLLDAVDFQQITNQTNPPFILPAGKRDGGGEVQPHHLGAPGG